MAITTLDGAIAGMLAPVDYMKIGAATVAGRFYSPFYVAGYPGAAAAPTPGVAGAALTTYAGQIPWTNPGAGNSYLARLSGTASQTGTLYLCDRLWHNSGLSPTVLTAQTVGSVAFPARDSAGAVAGADVFIGMEVTTVMGSGTPNVTITYTNSGGTTGQVSPSLALATTMAVGSFIPLPLKAGDVGVGAIASLTLSATMTSGAFSLVAYRELASVPVTTANILAAVDALTGGFVRLYNNTVPFILFLPTTTTAPVINASLIVTQG